MIRVALVGCGEHARVSHAAPLARYAAEHPGEISLAAACDVDAARAEAFRRDFGFERATTDVDALLDARAVDAYVTVVPVDRIADVGVRMLRRGVPCVIEKPLGASLAEAERLARVALETNTPHMVSVNRRFLPYVNRACDWAREIGPLRYVRATMTRHERTESDFVTETAIHAVDALRHVAGEVVRFDVEVLGAGVETTWYVVSLRFASGAVGCVEVLPTSGVVEESYELFGEGFRARVVVAGAGPQRSLELWRGGALAGSAAPAADEPEDRLNGSYDETVRFISALRDGVRPRPEIADVLPSARICFAIAERASARERPTA